MPLKPKVVARIGKRMFLIPFRTSKVGVTASIAFVGEDDPGIPSYSYTLSWTGGSLPARTAWEWQESTDGTTWSASTSESASATSASILISLRDQIRYYRVREVSATENGPWSMPSLITT